jgi:Protein of unknown function (DUF3592)
MLNRILIMLLIGGLGLIGVLTLLLGVALLALCLYVGLPRSRRTRATVLRYEADAPGPGGRYVLELTASGATHQARLPGPAAGPEAYSVGQEVTVYYPPTAPGEAVPRRFGGLGTALFLLLSGGIIILGVVAGGVVPILSGEPPSLIDEPW